MTASQYIGAFLKHEIPMKKVRMNSRYNEANKNLLQSRCTVHTQVEKVPSVHLDHICRIKYSRSFQ